MRCLRLCGNAVVAGGDQGAVDDQDGVLAEPLVLLQGERRPEVVDEAVGRGPRKRGELPQRQVGPPVRGNQQDTILRSRLHGRPLRTGSAPSRRGEVISLPN